MEDKIELNNNNNLNNISSPESPKIIMHFLKNSTSISNKKELKSK